MAQGDLNSLKRDLDMVRSERDKAQQQVQRSAAAQRQAEAVRLHNFIRALSIATRLRGLKSTPPTFANAVRSAVPASFELPPPGSLQFLALMCVSLAAVFLTSPQVPDLEDLANVLRQAVATPSPMTTPEAPVGAPELSFAIPAPLANPRAAAPLRAPGGAPQPPSPTTSPTDAALASFLEWIPEIPKGCEDEVAHAFNLQLFRHYGASVSSLPQSPIRDQWTRVRSHAPNLPGVAEVMRTFLASPPPVQRLVDSPAASPAEARRRGVALPTAMSGWTPAHTPAATTTMLRPPSSPTHTPGTPA